VFDAVALGLYSHLPYFPALELKSPHVNPPKVNDQLIGFIKPAKLTVAVKLLVVFGPQLKSV
jgi:hypothetical protein